MKNPELYQALQNLNKGRMPKVVNGGEPASFTIDRGVDGHVQLHATGELYAINCPHCSDTRGRLRVHHLWGIPYHIVGYNNPGEVLERLAYCQNEQKQIPLAGYLRSDYRPDPTLALKTAIDNALAAPPKECPTMGECIPLQNIPTDHSTYQYLHRRGFSPRYLGEVCGAVIMAKHPDPDIDKMSRNRIGFPHYVNGVLRLWQARRNFDIKKVPGVPEWPPKWWYPSNMIKVPWNVDVAAAFPVVILSEGILSAVNTGPAGIAIGGKSMTPTVRQIIRERWKRAFVMLDPDAGINRKAGEKDWQEIAMHTLREDGLEVTGVKWTPGDLRDPGDLGFLGTSEVIKASDPFTYGSLSYFCGGG